MATLLVPSSLGSLPLWWRHTPEDAGFGAGLVFSNGTELQSKVFYAAFCNGVQFCLSVCFTHLASSVHLVLLQSRTRFLFLYKNKEIV